MHTLLDITTPIVLVLGLMWLLTQMITKKPIAQRLTTLGLLMLLWGSWRPELDPGGAILVSGTVLSCTAMFVDWRRRTRKAPTNASHW